MPRLPDPIPAMMKAARTGGRIAHDIRADSVRLAVGTTLKERGDYVTEADRAAEDAIRAILARARPEAGFVLEESGMVAGGNETWIVDPIDGTTNYRKGLSEFAVAIALMRDGVPVASVIHLPDLGGFYWAHETTSGAWVRPDEDGPDRRLEADAPLKADDALVALAIGIGNVGWFASRLQPILEKVAAIRGTGASSVDLVRTAAGLFDAYLKPSLKIWDAIPGAYLAAKAGARVTDLNGKPIDNPDCDCVHCGLIAANPGVYDVLMSLID
ncbi:MAG: inositol monophosphatase [Pseudomonadota bacterium]|nr:inositol monophosphatase [Pseudomonadota bacterium]